MASDHIVTPEEWADPTKFALCKNCSHPVFKSTNQHCNYAPGTPAPSIVAQDRCTTFDCGCTSPDITAPPPACTSCMHSRKGNQHVRFDTTKDPYLIIVKKCQVPGCGCTVAS